MKIAVISDIHANLEAFQAVVASIEKRVPDRVICLGDLVGYGPDPEEVVQLMRKVSYDCVIGNHEVALLKRKGLAMMNFQARDNSISTKELLSVGNISYINMLPYSLTVEKALFVHGFPPDSVFKYVFKQSESVLRTLFESSSTTHYFVGHSHALLLIGYGGRAIVKSPLKEGRIALESGMQYLINVGSVGQPRDGDNRAKYVIWDTVENTLEVVYVRYDLEATIKKIEARGFPEAYGLRLR